MKTVVVVEDEPCIRENLVEILQISGYTCFNFVNGQEAKQWLMKNNPPDLILSDVMMPILTGYELLMFVRSVPSLAHIPIILMSAKSPPEDLITGKQCAVAAYLTKPFRMNDLLNTVAQFV